MTSDVLGRKSLIVLGFLALLLILLMGRPDTSQSNQCIGLGRKGAYDSNLCCAGLVARPSKKHFICRAPKVGRTDSGEVEITRIEEASAVPDRSFDAILVIEQSFKNLPKRLRYSVMKKRRTGTPTIHAIIEVSIPRNRRTGPLAVKVSPEGAAAAAFIDATKSRIQVTYVDSNEVKKTRAAESTEYVVTAEDSSGYLLGQTEAVLVGSQSAGMQIPQFIGSSSGSSGAAQSSSFSSPSSSTTSSTGMSSSAWETSSSSQSSSSSSRCPNLRENERSLECCATLETAWDRSMCRDAFAPFTGTGGDIAYAGWLAVIDEVERIRNSGRCPQDAARQFDTDGNGSLNSSELRNILRSLPSDNAYHCLNFIQRSALQVLLSSGRVNLNLNFLERYTIDYCDSANNSYAENPYSDPPLLRCASETSAAALRRAHALCSRMDPCNGRHMECAGSSCIEMQGERADECTVGDTSACTYLVCDDATQTCRDVSQRRAADGSLERRANECYEDAECRATSSSSSSSSASFSSSSSSSNYGSWSSSSSSPTSTSTSAGNYGSSSSRPYGPY